MTQPIDLDALIDAEYAASVEAAQARNTVEAEARRAKRDAAISAFVADLAADLGDDLIAALGIRFDAVDDLKGDWHGRGQTEADPQTGIAWKIVQAEARQYGAHPNWECMPMPDYRAEQGGNVPRLVAQRGQLKSALLARIGQQRARKRAWAVEEEKKRTANALREEQRAREQQAKDAQREERRAVFQAEQARLQAIVDTVTAQARATLWTWPEGVTVTLYSLTWCRGVSDDEGEYYVLTGDGWTAVDQLNADGYVTLEATRPYGNPRDARALKLDMQAHKPVWERKTYGATAELPSELRYDVRIAAPGITLRSNHEFARVYWVEDPDDSAVVDLGVALPLPWVRALVDAAAGRTSEALAPVPADDPFDVPY